jgi:hypothetical protein
MASEWSVRQVEHSLCGQGLDLVQIEVAYDDGGEAKTLTVDYHLVDLVEMEGDLRENISHLIDVSVAYRLRLNEAQRELSALAGLEGSVQDADATLGEHPRGTAEDHPPFPEYIDPVVQT